MTPPFLATRRRSYRLGRRGTASARLDPRSWIRRNYPAILARCRETFGGFITKDSWFYGANTPGKARSIAIYAPGAAAYRERCEDVARRGYEGFELRRREPAEALSDSA